MKFTAFLAFFGAASAVKLESEGPCVYLDETPEELAYQVDMFSRTLDERYWTNV